MSPVDASRPLVLVVDDDVAIRTVVRWQLEDAGFAVVEAADGSAAVTRIVEEPPALVVLDLSMPGLGGLEVLRGVRGGRLGRTDLPVIVLSGRSAESDRITGLDLGADDYLVKPFSPGELAARVRSVLRRTAGAVATEVITAGPVRIEPRTRAVSVAEVAVELTPREFDLLMFLATHPRHAFTRGQLLEQVWSTTSDARGEATVTEHVHRLRLKLEADPSHPRLLCTVRGVGYRFSDAS